MTLYEADKTLLKELVHKRDIVENQPIEKRFEKSDSWGIGFSHLFKDINASIHFSFDNNEVFVRIGEDCFMKGHFIEDLIHHYNITMDYQVRVIQRLRLIEWLEKERFIIWANSGVRSNRPPIDKDHFFLIDEIDKQFVRKNVDYEAVATEELRTFVNKKFRTSEDIKHKNLVTITCIAIGVSILIGIASIIFGK